MFKVVAFKGNRDPDAVFVRTREEQQTNDNKLANNFSRARSMVLQYALCNPWDYFFTGTLDEKKYDRYNVDKFMNDLSQFVRDKRKKYDAKFQVLLIPEHHQNKAWHVHGLIYGLPDEVLRPFRPPEPQHLIDGGFLNWEDYMHKFGFCSLGRIRDPVATAYYVTKYISKDLSSRSGDLGKHLYFHSRPLLKAQPVSDVYAYEPQLEAYCTHDYDFCKTGMVEGANWFFPYQWDYTDVRDVQPLYPAPPKPLQDPLVGFDPATIDPYYEQLKMAGV